MIFGAFSCLTISDEELFSFQQSGSAFQNKMNTACQTIALYELNRSSLGGGRKCRAANWPGNRVIR
jgi:hypothetical protein